MSGVAAIKHSTPFSRGSALTLTDAVSDLTWSADGRAVYAGSADGMLHCFDASGIPVLRWRGHEGGVTRLRLKPGDAGVLASAAEDGRVALWDSASGKQLCLLADEGSWIEQLAWTPDGMVLAAAASKTISLWRGEESLGVWYDARRQILAMDWAPDSRRLASASNKGLYLWRLESSGVDAAEPMQLLSFPGAPVAVSWQPNGQALAVGTQDGFLQIWRQAMQKGGPRQQDKASQLTMRGYPGKVNCLAWHPTRPLIATAGGPEVVLWNLPRSGKGGAQGQPLRNHRKTVTALAWSADGRTLASGDRSGRLCLWDHKGQLIYTQDFDHEISALAWQATDGTLAIGTTGGLLQLLNYETASSNTSTTAPELGATQ